MTIKDGYNSQPFQIGVNARKGEKTMELWFIDLQRRDSTEKDDLLSYMTLDEAIELRDTLNKAIKEQVGL